MNLLKIVLVLILYFRFCFQHMLRYRIESDMFLILKCPDTSDIFCIHDCDWSSFDSHVIFTVSLIKHPSLLSVADCGSDRNHCVKKMDTSHTTLLIPFVARTQWKRYLWWEKMGGFHSIYRCHHMFVFQLVLAEFAA